MTSVETLNDLQVKANELNVKRSRVILKFVAGRVVRQGDLYIHMVLDTHPVGDFVKRNQLADGTTIGARHVLQGDYEVYAGVKLPAYVNARYPLGYAFRVHEDGAVLTHPEHAHVEIRCPGLFQVTHQMDMRTLQRVQD